MGFVRRDGDTIVVATPGLTVEVPASSLVYAVDRGGWTAVRWQGQWAAEGYRFPIEELASLFPADAIGWVGGDRAFVHLGNARGTRPLVDGFEVTFADGDGASGAPVLHTEQVRTTRHRASEPPFALLWQDELPELAELRVARRPLARDRSPYHDLVAVFGGGELDDVVLEASEALFEGQSLAGGAAADVLGLYVDHDLVTRDVVQYSPHVDLPFLCVRGDLRCRRVVVRGATVWVGGDLHATEGVFVFGGEFVTERRGALSVGGTLHAPVLYVGAGDVFGARVGDTRARVVAADPRRVSVPDGVHVEELASFDLAARVMAETVANRGAGPGA